MILVAALVTALAVVAATLYLVRRYIKQQNQKPIRDVNPEGGIIFDTVPDFDFGEPLNWFVRIGDMAGQEFHNSRTEKTAHYPGVQKALGVEHFRNWWKAMTYISRNPVIEDWTKLQPLIDDLSYKQQYYFLVLILNLAHMYRMGSPESPVPRGKEPPELSPECVCPEYISKPQMYLAKKLGVPHSFTLYTWIWANWGHKKLKPGQKFTNAQLHSNYDDIYMRFRFFPGMETEENFWKVWFMTEAHAARLYPIMTQAVDACRKKDDKRAKRLLMKFEPIATKMFSTFSDFITFEKCKVDEWQDIQGCLHWHDELTPGISGYQIPSFLAIDSFFMVPLPAQIRQSKQKNTVCQPFHIQRFLTRLELQRHSVFKWAAKTKDKDISKTFSNILRKLMIFRSRHLAQCRPYLRRATTTARNFHESAGGDVSAKKAAEMGQDFSGSTNAKQSDEDGPFAQEMNQLIKATKGCKAFKGGSLENMLSIGAVTSAEDQMFQDHVELGTKHKKINRFSVAATEIRQKLLTLQNTWVEKKTENRRLSAGLM